MPTARKPPKAKTPKVSAPEPEVAPSASPAGRRWEITLDGFRPSSLNEIMHGHWARGAALKKRDRRAIAIASRLAGTPAATGKRRVSLRITLPKGRRRHDVDAFLKTTLDACTHAGLIVDDHPRWVEWGGVQYQRGEVLSTTLILEEIP